MFLEHALRSCCSRLKSSFSFLFSKSQAEPTWNRIYFLFRLCCTVCSMAFGTEVEKPCGGPSMDWSWTAIAIACQCRLMESGVLRCGPGRMGWASPQGGSRLLLWCGGHFVWSGFSRWLCDPSHLRPCLHVVGFTSIHMCWSGLKWNLVQVSLQSTPTHVDWCESNNIQTRP